jgi:hypothetical protein
MVSISKTIHKSIRGFVAYRKRALPSLNPSAKACTPALASSSLPLTPLDRATMFRRANMARYRLNRGMEVSSRVERSEEVDSSSVGREAGAGSVVGKLGLQV